jgi:L-asparagine transporter-like permease
MGCFSLGYAPASELCCRSTRQSTTKEKHVDSLFSSAGNAFGGLLSLVWLVIIIMAIVKVAKSRASTVAKVIWIIVLLAFPLIGFIIWLLFGPRG